MNLFEHMDKIDETVAIRQEQETRNLLTASQVDDGSGATFVRGFMSHGHLPWRPGSTTAKMTGGDFDGDGYPDFVDFHLGDGAYSPFDVESPGDQ
jgi:hypothetical protein